MREERDRGSEREEVRVGRGGRELSERERGEIRAREKVGREIDRVGREIERGVSGAIEREWSERVFRKDLNEIFEPSLVYCLDLLCSLQSFSGIM